MRKTVEALKAEYLDQHLWQFVSIDEWLAANGYGPAPESR